MTDLMGVKAGDWVMFSGRFGEGCSRKLVDRVTKQHVICGSEKFRISNGARLGDTTWSQVYAERFDQNVWDISQRRAKFAEDAYCISQFNWKTAGADAVAKVIAIMKGVTT